MTPDVESPPRSAESWLAEIKLAETTFEKWVTRGEKIIRRYRDERGQAEYVERRYNILWSNIQTLKPAVYSRRPKPEVSRRFKDSDPVGRVASQILERALDFESEHYNDVHSAISHALMDRFLPGRGVAWIRYDPTIEREEVTLENEPDSDPESEGEGYERVSAEYSPVEYIHWKDFLLSPARTWEEVRWVARVAYMSREKGKERFGADFDRVPLGEYPMGMSEDEAAKHPEWKQAKVYEIWCKESKSVYWLAKGYPELLDHKDDPLELEGFYPCPKPLFASLSTDTLIPVPDYAQYQDQAEEIDQITQRIKLLTDACKVVGLYNSSEKELAGMLASQENRMIPVDSWGAFVERGGIKGNVEWMPIEVIAEVLERLYNAREQLKQAVYEITGLSDILRGASKAEETATAQQIKANYGGLRLKELQNDVARFASDLFRMKAEIMCARYQPDRLLKMSGVESIVTDADVASQVAPIAQQAQQQMQGIPPAMQAAAQQQVQAMIQQATKQAKAMLVQQAVALLQDEPARNFRIEVNSDSFVELDEQAEKESRVEFMQGMGQFASSLLPITQAFPEMSSVVGEMLLFAARGFRAGRGLESTLEEAIEKLRNKPPPGPPPELAIKQQEAQLKEQQAQRDDAREDRRMAMEQQQAERESQMETQRFLREMQQDQEQFRQTMQQQWQEFVAGMQMKRAEHAQNMARAQESGASE